MQPSRSSRYLRSLLLRNELGQMSIFLALIFQVLFVFFAMVINIGLLVHDKINLQNSVDLGAFYAAQKQAEILNEIAHLNYQIRQDYKLLAWRYWVLGTLGRDGGPGNGPMIPPARRQVGSGIPPDVQRLYAEIGAPSLREEVPVACLATPQWWEFAQLSPGLPPNENYCWHAYQWTSPAIPQNPVPPTPATIIANIFQSILVSRSVSNYTLSCREASPLSWAFVAAILTDYKHAVSYKKKAIKKLRANLVSVDPKDREGKSIREGVIQTIRKNLTESNRASFDADNAQVLNGLSKGTCALNDGVVTLPEVLTAPGLYYALLSTQGTNCSFDIRFQTQISEIQGGIARFDPGGELVSRVSGEPTGDDEFHSTLGFEKNPWCMAYMGVKATTKPRKPFAPFGKSVNLVARAFAQPFGGRIGPWYSRSWNKASMTSDPVAPPQASNPPNPNGPIELNPGPNQQERTDPLTSPRLTPGSGGQYVYTSYTIPNFSRYPGDILGLRSQRAQAGSRIYFSQTRGGTPSGPGFDDYRVRLVWLYNYASMRGTGDTLAFDNPSATSLGNIPQQVNEFRSVEMAAVAPNLFDISYYSIDPAADENYTAVAKANPARYGISGAAMGDIGTRNNVPEYAKLNVQSQINAANGINTGGVPPGVDPSLVPRLFWVVRKWEHLLTSWAPHRVTNFGFPSERFGKCGSDAIPGVMIPGKCTAGGRTGYSVRVISREHLNGPWQIGGENRPAETLLNPPGDDSQF